MPVHGESMPLHPAQKSPKTWRGAAVFVKLSFTARWEFNFYTRIRWKSRRERKFWRRFYFSDAMLNV
jgi:hypothetical protein